MNEDRKSAEIEASGGKIGRSNSDRGQDKLDTEDIDMAQVSSPLSVSLVSDLCSLVRVSGGEGRGSGGRQHQEEHEVHQGSPRPQEEGHEELGHERHQRGAQSGLPCAAGQGAQPGNTRLSLVNAL